MSGVFGIITKRQDVRLGQAILRMGNAMRHREWYTVETWKDESSGVALGRIRTGVLNSEPQPVFSKGGNTVLFLAGEFFDREATTLPPSFRREQFQTDAEYALKMYERYGKEIARYLAGTFVLVLYDRSRQIVLLLNDRFGLYPLYLEYRRGYLAFAPEVKGLLVISDREYSLDEVALAQYMRFQQLLGNRTFFQGIHLLAPATLLVFDLKTGIAHQETYWSFDQIPAQPNRLSFQEAAEETTRLMRLAVRRRIRGVSQVGIYLSGGLDSRVILAAYPSDAPRPITLTFGLRNSRDMHYAARVARRARVPHYSYEFSDGNWVKEHADFHLTLTEGFQSWIHMHGISVLKAARELFDINLTGLGGDLILGGPSPAEEVLLQAPDEIAYLTRLFELCNQVYCWPGISEAEERVLYTPALSARLQGLAFESLRQEIQPYLRYDRTRRVDYFGFQVEIRHYGYYVTFTRSHLDVRYPYYDYDMVDFVLGLPVHFRLGRRLQVAVLHRLAPSLTLVPIEKDEYLPTGYQWLHTAHKTLQKIKRRFNRHIFPLFPERFPLHTDYEGWLRCELREWAESILLSPRTLQRGIFNPETLRSFWAQLQSGHPWMLGRIAPVMTYEMMLRRFYDSRRDQGAMVSLYAQ